MKITYFQMFQAELQIQLSKEYAKNELSIYILCALCDAFASLRLKHPQSPPPTWPSINCLRSATFCLCFFLTDVGVASTDNGFSSTDIGGPSTDNGFSSTDVGVAFTDNGFSSTDNGGLSSAFGFSSTDNGVAFTDNGFSSTDKGGPSTNNGFLPSTG